MTFGFLKNNFKKNKKHYLKMLIMVFSFIQKKKNFQHLLFKKHYTLCKFINEMDLIFMHTY